MPKREKVWKSYKWMYRQYVVKRLSEIQIAKLAGTNQSTINRWLKRHELNRRM